MTTPVDKKRTNSCILKTLFLDTSREFSIKKITKTHRNALLDATFSVEALYALCVAVCCSVLQCVVVCYSVLLYHTVSYNVLQCVAVCCSVLQRVTSQPQLTRSERILVYLQPSFWMEVSSKKINENPKKCSLQGDTFSRSTAIPCVLRCVAVCCSVL